MKKNKEMLAKAQKAVLDRKVHLSSGKLMLVVDLPEDMQGVILMAEEAQAEPHSGVIVMVADDIDDDIVGSRVYYRPYSPFEFMLGPDSDMIEVGTIHYKDVVAYETDPQ